jgi:hypothetical protein
MACQIVKLRYPALPVWFLGKPRIHAIHWPNSIGPTSPGKRSDLGSTSRIGSRRSRWYSRCRTRHSLQRALPSVLGRPHPSWHSPAARRSSSFRFAHDASRHFFEHISGRGPVFGMLVIGARHHEHVGPAASHASRSAQRRACTRSHSARLWLGPSFSRAAARRRRSFSRRRRRCSELRLTPSARVRTRRNGPRPGDRSYPTA